MPLAHPLLKQAWQQAEAPAILNGTVLHASYGDRARRSAAAAQRLRDAGSVVMPVKATRHPAEVAWIIDNAQARWGFVIAEREPGDIGSPDEHGFLPLKDRSKDLITSGGSNIQPREVEEVALTAPGVAGKVPS